MERKMVNGHGTTMSFEYVEKWKSYLMRSIFKDGGMHLMFIKDVEEEIELLKSEGYEEARE